MTNSKHVFLTLIFVSLAFLSCEKEEVIPTTSLTKTQILVKYTWQIDEILRNSSGKNSRYIKGGINTTGINYNLVRITFKENGTGTYTTDLGQTFPATWKFTSSNQKNMEFSVSFPAIITYTWNFVEISDGVSK